MANFVGTEFGDTLSGTTDSDNIFGVDGDDILSGLGGDDALSGGGGNDRLSGGEGMDTLRGDIGDDTLLGGKDKDRLNGGKGSDLLKGGRGDDRLLGADGGDTLIGGVGSDFLNGANGADILRGAFGNDKLLGGAGNDRLFGGRDIDMLLGGDGHDVLKGGLGDDILEGLADNDRLFGGAGNDNLLGGNGADHLAGGTGDDTIDGGNGNDTVLAGAGDDIASGGAGNDTVSGFLGDDTLRYIMANNSSARDVYNGGKDTDTLTLEMTAAEWARAEVRSDVVAYLSFLDQHIKPKTGFADKVAFQFSSFDLTVSGFEKVQIIVDGVEPQLAAAVSATIGEDDPDVSGTFNVIDPARSDTFRFEITGAPEDDDGNQYGAVQNNGDGTFTFMPGDQFQFLNAGESRNVSFEYIAVNTSSAEETETVPNAVTVTVTGANDDDLSFDSDMRFVTLEQSIFDTGPNVRFDLADAFPALEFIGLEWDQTLVEMDIAIPFDLWWPTIPPVNPDAGALDALKTALTNFASSDHSDPGWVQVSTPAVSIEGSTNGRIGLQPVFELTSGGLQSIINIDAVFTVPNQVEAGETFTITSEYSLQEPTDAVDFDDLVENGAFFDLENPHFNFSLDLVAEVGLDLELKIGASTLGPAQTIDLFPYDPLNGTISLFSLDTLADGMPDINAPLPGFLNHVDVEFFDPTDSAVGFLADEPSTGDIASLNGTQESDFFKLTADIGSMLSDISGIPFSIDRSVDIGFPGFFSLFSMNFDLKVLSVELENTLSVIQDFSLGLEDLPLKVVLEDGSEIVGLSLGDDITVTAPEDFDADVDGDADGQIDFAVEVDMQAVFSHLAKLGFSTDLELGALKMGIEMTSDIFPGSTSFSLFPNGGIGNSDGFLYSTSVNIAEADNIVTIFDNDRFAVNGWNEFGDVEVPEGNPTGIFNGHFDIA